MSKILVRSLYILLFVGYLVSLLTVYYLKDPLKKYNRQLIEYSIQASDGFSVYRDFKDAEAVVDKELELKEKEVQKNVKIVFSNTDLDFLIKELTLDTPILETSLYKQVRSQISAGFKFNPFENFEKAIAESKNHPVMEKLYSVMINEKAVSIILLLLSFPAFSPLIISVLLKVLISKRYIKRKASKIEIYYTEKISDIYTTNLVLAILSIMIFVGNVYLGLIFAIGSHLIFIYQVAQGVFIRSKVKI